MERVASFIDDQFMLTSTFTGQVIVKTYKQNKPSVPRVHPASHCARY